MCRVLGSRASYLVDQNLGELKLNLWDSKGIVIPQKGYRLPTLLLGLSMYKVERTRGSGVTTAKFLCVKI